MPLVTQKLLTVLLVTILSVLLGMLTGNSTVFFFILTGGVIYALEFLDEKFWPNTFKKVKDFFFLQFTKKR